MARHALDHVLHGVLGERLVLCHGCFDLLHVGHIKHLQEAAALGDKLLVSVTADRFVNKGAGRPHFNEQLRMEALRALRFVDEVVLCEEPTPASLIDRMKPDVYVKGADYGVADLPEAQNVLRYGGKIHITTGETFSSSRLINQQKFDARVVQFLEGARDAGFRDHLLSGFEEADRHSYAFVGETIIDEYSYVRALGKTSKEFVIASEVDRSEVFRGGIEAAAKHAEWRNVDIVTIDEPVRKQRFIDADFNRKLFELYYANPVSISSIRRAQFVKDLGTMAVDRRRMVVFDFGHGLLRSSDIALIKSSTFAAVNCQSNAGNYGFNLITKYAGVELACVDEPEARLATGIQYGSIDDVVVRLQEAMRSSQIIVTQGRHGCMVGLQKMPAFSQNVVDTMGAGDAFLAVAGPLVSVGVPIQVAAFAGNVAGAIKVSIIGHRRHVGRQELIQTIEALLK